MDGELLVGFRWADNEYWIACKTLITLKFSLITDKKNRVCLIENYEIEILSSNTNQSQPNLNLHC